MSYIGNNLIDFDSNMYLTVDYFKEKYNKITGSKNINLIKVDVKPYRLGKMYMDKDLIKYKLYQLTDQFTEKKITSINLYSIPLNKINPFYDENGRTCRYCLLIMIK